MSTAYGTRVSVNEEIFIGTKSAGSRVNNIRKKRFTWHITPFVFYQLSLGKPSIFNDDNDTILSFDEFIKLVEGCDIQEVELL